MNTSPAFAEIVTNSVDVLLNQIPPPERTDQSLEKKLSLIKKRVSEFFEQEMLRLHLSELDGVNQTYRLD